MIFRTKVRQLFPIGHVSLFIQSVFKHPQVQQSVAHISERVAHADHKELAARTDLSPAKAAKVLLRVLFQPSPD